MTKEWTHRVTHAGRLGVLLAGLGSISTTLIAGVEAIKKGLGRPIGSLALLGALDPNGTEDAEYTYLRDCLDLARLDDLVFGGWDIFPRDCYTAARHAAVLRPALLEQLCPQLSMIRPWPGIWDQRLPQRNGDVSCKKGRTLTELVDEVKTDILRFQDANRLKHSVVLWCGSTETFLEPSDAHQSIDAFEAALRANDYNVIAPSMVYAYAALSLGLPFVNATPSRTIDIPALIQLAQVTGSPMAGKDLKTGQTLLKTILAPGLRDRMLGLEGWFSTNILGNGDGETLDDPAAFRTKQESKLAVLKSMLRPDLYPELYGRFHHDVKINYYPPAGDNKESWDAIDIFGWLDYPMSIRVDFLCRDSILAAPLLLDLSLFMDLAKRANLSGPQEWLSFYFKSPMIANGGSPEHELSVQFTSLQRELRRLAPAPRRTPAKAG